MRIAANAFRPPIAVTRIAIVASVVLVELGIIGGMLLATRLDCTPIGMVEGCDLMSWVVSRGAGAVGLGALYLTVRLRPHAGAGPVPDAHRAAPRFWPVVQVAGFGLLILPLLLAGDDVERLFAIGRFLWPPATVMAAGGALLWLMPWRAWAGLLREDYLTPMLVVLLGLAAPTLVARADLAWTWEPLARATFEGVAALARLFGDAHAAPEAYTVTLDYFAVEIAEACSGIQGIALITGLLLAYFWIDRGSLNFRRAWVLVPVAIVLSFLLNVARITLLLVIGARYSPALADEGFHGHAGWLMFVLLGLPIVAVARAAPWFHTRPATRGRPAPPLLRDPKAALIIPFMAWMLTSLLASTFAVTPGLWYPLRVMAVGAAILPFLPALRRHVAWPDLLPIGAGIAVGVAWALTEPAAGGEDAALAGALASLPPLLLAGWVVCRAVGSVLLVPLVEESVFRGYLLTRLDGPGWRRVAALLVSSAAFALLHERQVAGLLAGLVFGLVMLRRGRLADAVACHAAANLVLAAAAVAAGDWAGF